MCFTPKERATSEVLRRRRSGVLYGQTATHWPHRYNSTDGFTQFYPDLWPDGVVSAPSGLTQFTLSKSQRVLVDGVEEDEAEPLVVASKVNL